MSYFGKTSLGNYRFNPILLLVAGLVSVISAMPYAGSWFDGSRLAAVECLVDYHTWQIDQSIFLGTASRHAAPADYPYGPNDTQYNLEGTKDKVFINGHFYSEKTPVVSLGMAAVYQVLQWTTGLKAAAHPRIFCYVMTLLCNGSVYVFAIACLDLMIASLGLATAARLLLTYSFALGTIALPFLRYINNGIPMLAVFAAIYLLIAKFTEPGWATFSKMQLAAIGALMGLGYAIDLGVGPILVLGVTGYIAYLTRSWRSVALVLAASFPFFVLHHVINYMIGGTFKPINTVPAYFQWPGSPFSGPNLNGTGWMHSSFGEYLRYSLEMQISRVGFINHDPVLFLALLGLALLLREKFQEKSAVFFSLFLIGGTWQIYAITTDNYSGSVCAVRWFIPLLVPFYYILAVFLKRHPQYLGDLAILSGWSFFLGLMMWHDGPWTRSPVPAIWYIMGGTLLSWIAYRIYCQFAKSNAPTPG